MTARPLFLPIYYPESDMWKRYNFSMEDARKGYPFVKNGIYKGKGLQQSFIA